MATLVGQTVSHYRILEQLGGGGMGIVYKAQDLKLDRRVALKFLPPDLTRNPEAKQRFIREARAASALDHQNICVVHDIGETDEGQIFIVMAFYDGQTLEKRIKQGPLTIDESISIAHQLALGLGRAHEYGIVHRDIKPANIMIPVDGTVKIVDFGLAKLAGTTMLTRAGSTLGTAAYMSPEQASGEAIDQRTDIWSFGVVLYEMITGERPFKAEYENALIYSILNVEPRPPSDIRTDVPAHLNELVAKCLARRPGDRYQHMDEIIAGLHPCTPGNIGTRSAQVHTPVPPPTQKQRRGLWYGLAAFGLIALGIVGYVLMWSGNRDVLPASRLKMIAVLPFENLGPAEDEYFADGLTEEITSRLGSISGLGVISRQSVMQYKRSAKTLPAVAEELGADYVLAATIRWVRTDSGARVRITPHLLQVPGDVQLWSDNMDKTLGDIFRVQSEIALRVVQALGVVLREGEKGAIGAIPTSNLDAYQAYLKGIASLGDIYQEVNTKTAIEMFRQAVALDSTFASAYVALARAHLAYHWAGFDRTEERLKKSKLALERAFALQPDLPEAYGVLSLYYYRGYRDYDRALAIIGKVEKKLPNDSEVHALLGYILRRQGKFEEAAEELKKAFTLDPKNGGLAGQVGNTLCQLGDYAAAEEYLDRAIALKPEQATDYTIKSNMYLYWRGDTNKSRSILESVPAAYLPRQQFVELDIYERNYQTALDRLARVSEPVFVGQHSIVPVSQLRGLIYRYMGDSLRSRASFDTARVIVESEITKKPGDYRLHISLGIIYAGLGRREEAVQQAERATELMPISRDAVTGVFPLIGTAQVYALVGRHDAAVDKLEYLLSLRAPKLITPPLLHLDPVYDPLKSSPRFRAFLTRNG